MVAKRKKIFQRISVYDKTVDYHRHTLDEAIEKIEILIYSRQYKSIKVIHGFGQGILKNGLRRYFANHKLIKEFYSGEELLTEGGDGVTVIYM